MAEQPTVPKATGLVNIVGVNNLGGAPNPMQQLQFNPGNPGVLGRPVVQPQFQNIPDITDQKYAQIRQQTEQQYNDVVQGYQALGQTKAAQLAAKGAPQRMGELAQVLGTLSSAAMDYIKIQSDKAAAKEQAALEWQKKEAANRGSMARIALEETSIKAQDYIQQYGLEQGSNLARADMERVMQEFSDLPPDIQEPLWTFVGTQLRDIEGRVTTRTIENAQELRRNQVAQTTSMIKATVATNLAPLTDPTLPQSQADSIMGDVMQYVRSNTEDLDPVDRLQIMSSITESMLPYLQEGSAGRYQMASALEQMNNAYNIIETQIRPQYGDNPYAFQQHLAALAIQNPAIRDLLGEIPNNQDMFKELASYQQTQQEYQTRMLQEQMQSGGYNATQIAAGTELAWRMMRGDAPAQATLTQLQRRDPERLSPEEALALDYYKNWSSARDQYYQLQGQYSQAVNEAQNLIIKFTAGNTPQETTYVDNSTQPPRAYRLLVRDENGGATYLREDATEEQLRNAQSRVETIQAQINDLQQRTYSQGFNILDPNDRTVVDQMSQTALSIQNSTPLINEFRQETGLPSLPGSYQQRTSVSGFNPASSGYPSGDAPERPLARIGGVVAPFASNYSNEISISSEYGNRVHPVYGDVRPHWGADMAGEVLYQRDVGALSPSGGTVLSAEEWDGYGGTVMVRTPEGYIEQYSHLRGFQVKPGDQIRPGAIVGIVGGDASDPMPGTSTGRHLHFQVWKPGTQDYVDPEANTLDPMAYLQGVHIYEQQPIGVGQVQTPTAPTYAPTPDALGMGGGNWVSGAPGSRYPYLSNTNQSMRLPAESMYGMPRRQQTAAPQQSGNYRTQAVGLLREFEGFSPTAYWDVNAYRVGYGSDTIGGTGTPVTPDTTTTREEAERDLLARLDGFESTVRSQVGDSFDRLPDGTKAALLSVAYNYGSLPGNVVDAVTSGNPAQIGDAIDSLAGDDGGINASRRAKEAEVARSGGGFAPNPAPVALAPGIRSAYPMPNNRNNNYGYQVIAQTPSFAYAIANAANDVGIPAQWLADTLAYFTGGTFTPRQVSEYKNAAEVVTNVTLPLLRRYRGQINTIEQLFNILSNGTPNGQADPNALMQLGNGVGRRYRTSNDTLQSSLFMTHDSFHQGCPTCTQQMNRYGTIIPHEALG